MERIMLLVNGMRVEANQVPVFANDQMCLRGWVGRAKSAQSVLHEYHGGAVIIDPTIMYYVHGKLGSSPIVQELAKHNVAFVLVDNVETIEVEEETDTVFLMVHDPHVLEEGNDISVAIDWRDYQCTQCGKAELTHTKVVSSSRIIGHFRYEYDRVTAFLRLQIPDRMVIVYAQSIDDLTAMTGQDSTFAYHNKLVGLVYLEREMRPDTHEIAHALLNGIGTPPYLFVEGMAVLASDRLLYSKRFGKSIVERVAQKYPNNTKYECVLVMLSGKFQYKHAQAGFDVIAAAFLSYLCEKVGMDKVLECYKAMSRDQHSDVNMMRFRDITGYALHDVLREWLAKS